MSRTHSLKTWPEPFQAVLDGRKRFEVRVDDRGFAVGDVLLLQEWNPREWDLVRDYTGREHRVRVTYIAHGGAWGIPLGLCVMSIAPVEETTP